MAEALYTQVMPQNPPVLYSFRRCPYAMRARMALRYAGIRCELREVKLADKPAELLAISPKGTVPVLHIVNSAPQAEGMAGQEVVDESLEIMLWAIAQHDPDGWLNVDLTLAEDLLSANDEGFKIWLDRYKYPDRAADEAVLTADVVPRAECERFIQLLEARLQGNAYLAGNALSFVDVAIFPFIRQFAHVDKGWFFSTPYTEVVKWLNGLLESSLFASVMRKYPVWRSGTAGEQF